VIYGPNNSGKTSILSSLLYAKKLIFENNSLLFNELIQKLALLKNSELMNDNTEWVFEFLINNTIYRYKIFLSKNGIEFEELIKYNNSRDSKDYLIFRRKNNVVDLNNDFAELNLNLEHINCTLLSYLSLFSKSNYISLVLSEINKFYSFDDNTSISSNISNDFNIQILDEQKNKLLRIFKYMDLNIIDIEIKKTYNNEYLILLTKQNSFGVFKVLLNEESKSTQKTIKLICNLIELSELGGGLLIIDELDSSLHPKLLGYIINSFHSDNNKNIQVLFTSNDIYTLDRRFFRKDEIYFTCLDRNHYTDLVCLNEFKDIKEGNSYSKKYTEGSLGFEPSIARMKDWDDSSN
ncbi:MAG: ATP-binding protein, partial [Ureaplasma sp.]|nr:ATP-binding protein [Ureaplasma sp.]